jgi:hypothetical protein
LRGLCAKPQQTRDAAFGRAIGRVVAHELLHIFAETAVHSDHGVDHPTLTVQDLLADHLEFAELEPMFHIVHAGPTTPPANQTAPAEAGRASYVRDGCVSCHGTNGEGTPHGPVLRRQVHPFNPVVLAAKLAKNQEKMLLRSRNLKLAPPSVTEDQISGLARFLNGLE